MDSSKLRVILTRRENGGRGSTPAKKPTAPSLEDETRDLSTLLTLYKIHLDIYNRESAGLQEVQKYILNTVDRSLSAVFMKEESSQEWLKALKDHFAPSDMGQKQYIDEAKKG
ncbi:hypothetical protein VDGL01_11128 [Verticillium dahliae]